MSDWIEYIKACAENAENPTVFQRLLNKGLQQIEEESRGDVAVESAQWLSAHQYLTFAIIAYKRGAEIFEREKQEAKAFAGYTNAGLYAHWHGDFQDAMASYQRAKEQLGLFTEETPFGRLQAEIALGLNYCDTLVALRKEDQALEKYQDLIEICRQKEDYEASIRCLLGCGNIYRNWGSYRLALQMYQDARQKAAERNYPQQLARAAHGEGNVLLEIDHISAAIDSFEKAIDAYKAADDLQGVCEAMILLGHSYHTRAEERMKKLQGRDDSVFEDLEQAKNLYRAAYQAATPDAPMNAIDAQIKLASLAFTAGRMQEALALYEHIRQHPLMQEDYLTARQVWQGLGNINDESNKLEEALAAFREGLILTQQANDPEGESDFSMMLGLTHEKKGELRKAESWYKKAIQIQEKLGMDLDEEPHQLGYFGKRANVYQLLISILLEEKKPEEAFLYLEKSKAKAMRDQLGRRLPDGVAFSPLGWEDVGVFLG